MLYSRVGGGCHVPGVSGGRGAMFMMCKQEKGAMFLVCKGCHVRGCIGGKWCHVLNCF